MIVSLSNPPPSQYSGSLACQGLAQDVLSELIEDACLGLCFEVHRAVKQGYFFLEDTDQESMKDFGKCTVPHSRMF